MTDDMRKAFEEAFPDEFKAVYWDEDDERFYAAEADRVWLELAEARQERWVVWQAACQWRDSQASAVQVSDLGNIEPAAYMFPSDISRFAHQEISAPAYSVDMGRPGEKTVELYTRAQVEALLQSATQPAPTQFKGWYCAHCQRGVDSSEVTFNEQHEVCGRYIADDIPPQPARSIGQKKASMLGETVGVVVRTPDGKIAACEDLGRVTWLEKPAQSAAQVPGGWKLVPIEPTPAMYRAVQEVDCDHGSFESFMEYEGGSISMHWHAMLQSAPHPAQSAMQAQPFDDVDGAVELDLGAFCADELFGAHPQHTQPAQSAADPLPGDRTAKEWRHIANEWADVSYAGLQWLKNIQEGISSVEEALENYQKCCDYAYKLTHPETGEREK
jgi:hypothetical protein